MGKITISLPDNIIKEIKKRGYSFSQLTLIGFNIVDKITLMNHTLSIIDKKYSSELEIIKLRIKILEKKLKEIENKINGARG